MWEEQGQLTLIELRRSARERGRPPGKEALREIWAEAAPGRGAAGSTEMQLPPRLAKPLHLEAPASRGREAGCVPLKLQPPGWDSLFLFLIFCGVRLRVPVPVFFGSPVRELLMFWIVAGFAIWSIL